jgi:homoserine dehydrogenase
MRVGVLGAGTVGLQVVRAFLERSPRLAPFDGAPLVLAGVAVRDIAKAREAGIPEALLTDAPAHLVASPEVDVVVELMGGDEPARTLVLASLAAGRPVVTANKHLLAHHGPELERVAREAASALRFEAAVAGGIPVLSPLAGDLAGNRVGGVRGIVNGTTNYILTAMARAGLDYGDVLADAQARGYAEADPTADVEGLDAVNKLVVLMRLAFGAWIEPAAIRNRVATAGGTGPAGITGVTAEDVRAIDREGRILRLLAAGRLLDDGSLQASVLPTAVAADSAFGRTDGVLNRVEIDGAPVGRVAFEGPGAGGPATASAVLGDLVAIARGLGSTWSGLPPAIERSGLVVRAPQGKTFEGPSGSRYPIADEPG